MGWLDTMTPKPGGSRHCSDDYMYMVHGAYVVAEADDKTVYFSAKYSSKCLKLRTPETLMRQGFIGFSDIRRHHIMHTVSGTFPINRAVLP